jgi:hypothetical protein
MLFKRLCDVQCCAQVFLNASKYEEREGCITEALDYCEKGLDMNFKDAKLWF